MAGATGAEERYLLSVGNCQQCGTIQLLDRMPVDVVRPRHDWLVYNEPEGHLDDVAGKLAGLPGVNASSSFLGVTYKDKSTLDRMARLGFASTACINASDLKAPVTPFGLETIQAILSDDSNVARLRDIYGRADVLLARHIVEHACDSNRFVNSLRGLLALNGYLVFELPDSQRIFRDGNHAFVWEEHITYFTAGSIRRLAETVGAELVWFGRYPYPYEDSLVVVLRFTGSDASLKSPPATSVGSAEELVGFAAGLEVSRIRWRRDLEASRARGENVAVFGAGHLAAKFVNFLELADLVDCVIDDHPNKIGMLMPGSHLPIVSSADLTSRRIRVCISTLNPESEARVRARLASFFDAGGRFVSAFTAA